MQFRTHYLVLDSSTKQTHDWTGLISQVKEAFRKGISEGQKKPPP